MAGAGAGAGAGLGLGLGLRLGLGLSLGLGVRLGLGLVVKVWCSDSSPMRPFVVRGTTHTSYFVPGVKPVRVYMGSEVLYYNI